MKKAIKIVGIAIVVTMVLVTFSPACVAEDVLKGPPIKPPYYEDDDVRPYFGGGGNNTNGNNTGGGGNGNDTGPP